MKMSDLSLSKKVNNVTHFLKTLESCFPASNMYAADSLGPCENVKAMKGREEMCNAVECFWPYFWVKWRIKLNLTPRHACNVGSHWEKKKVAELNAYLPSQCMWSWFANSMALHRYTLWCALHTPFWICFSLPALTHSATFPTRKQKLTFSNFRADFVGEIHHNIQSWFHCCSRPFVGQIDRFSDPCCLPRTNTLKCCTSSPIYWWTEVVQCLQLQIMNAANKIESAIIDHSCS